MPHYKDGTIAKHGDLVLSDPPYDGAWQQVGIVMSITPGSESCNAQLIPLAMRQKGAEPWLPMNSGSSPCVTLKDCMPVSVIAEERAQPAMAAG
jgi:hypothetical protein